MSQNRKEYLKTWAKNNPDKVKRKEQKYYYSNLDKMEIKRKTYREKYPDKIYNLHLKNRYGITLEQYNLMFKEQNGCCYICKQPETALGKGKKEIKKLSVDHDHTTLKVRKLLCDRCNKAMGNVKENFDIALNLCKYIQEYKNII